jgi:hypothetical protein
VPSPPKPRTGDEAGGAGSNRASVPGRGHDTTARFWTQCQSFLDNIIAGFRPNLSLNDRCLDEDASCPGLESNPISYGRIRFEVNACKEIDILDAAPAPPPPTSNMISICKGDLDTGSDSTRRGSSPLSQPATSVGWRPRARSLASKNRQFAPEPDISGPSLRLTNFQYPKFRSGPYQRPVALLRRPVCKLLPSLLNRSRSDPKGCCAVKQSRKFLATRRQVWRAMW